MTKKRTYLVSRSFESFIARVYPEPNTGCWIWGGKMPDKKRYPEVSVNGNKIAAHRYSYQHYNGDFNKSLHVLHKCDNTYCVNPDHLFLGTHQQNMIDRDSKGRHKPLIGTINGRSKLTDDQVTEIRMLYNPKRYPTRKLAKIFNVSQRLIFNIVHRLCWKHI